MSKKHHEQEELCKTRAAYRQGRRLTAVKVRNNNETNFFLTNLILFLTKKRLFFKVFTVNNESSHLYVYGVPQIKLRAELKSLFTKYGHVTQIHVVPDIETEAFTECYHINFERIQAARIAKRITDNRNFYGGVLHVCYAPEHETVEEARRKLLQRSKEVLTRLEAKAKGGIQKNSRPLSESANYIEHVEPQDAFEQEIIMHRKKRLRID